MNMQIHPAPTQSLKLRQPDPLGQLYCIVNIALWQMEIVVLFSHMFEPETDSEEVEEWIM